MITWELHYMEEVPDDLKQKYPDYENKPFLLVEGKTLDGKDHYVIYSNNPLIRVDPIRFAIRRYKTADSE